MDNSKKARGRRFRQQPDGSAEFNDDADRGDGRSSFGTFPKGRSGNSRGRPNGALNARTIIRQVLSERVKMTTPDGSKSVSKFGASVTKLANIGLTRDNVRALERTIALGLSVEDPAAAEKPPLPINAADQAVLALLAKRLGGLPTNRGDEFRDQGDDHARP